MSMVLTAGFKTVFFLTGQTIKYLHNIKGKSEMSGTILILKLQQLNKIYERKLAIYGVLTAMV